MNNIKIYTTSVCPYCTKAKQLLDIKGIPYTEINVEKNEEAKEDMIRKANGRKTVPQIFIGDMHIGGCDDLYELDESGKLDPLLKIL